MKKIMFCAFCSVLLSATSFAQTDIVENAGEPSTFSIGPSVGVGHGWIAPGSNWQYYPSWSVGIMSIYGPFEWWGIGYEVRYSVEGGKRHYESGDRITKLQYIRIPIKGMVFFGDYEDDFRPKLTLGPSMGFLLNKDDADDFGVKAYPFDLGANMSAGFNYRLRPGTWLNFDVNYYQGLLDVRKNTGRQEYNGNLGLNLGIAFGI